MNVGEQREIQCYESKGGHVVIPLYPNFTTEETVFLMNKEVDLEDEKKIRKIHETTNHKSENNMLHAYQNAGKLTDTVRKAIKKVIETCGVCQKYKKSQGKPKVSLTKVTDFNQIVTIDLKQFDGVNVLWLIDSFTRFIQGVVLKNKEAETVIEAMNSTWNWRFGFPSIGFWADNGPEFQNGDMEELASKLKFSVRFGPTYSPWSNGLNERNHYSADLTVRKVRETDKKITLQKAVDMAAWTHNTNTNILGYDPMSLVTGKSVTIPGISTGNIAMESMFDSEAVKRVMERHHEVMKEFREIEYSTKLKKAAVQQNKKFKEIKYEEDDWVFYQGKDKKAWNGPVRVHAHRGRDVYVFANGNLKKIADCKVQPYRVHTEENTFRSKNKKEIDSDDIHGRNEKMKGPKTRSRSKSEREEKNDVIGAYWMTKQNSECFDPFTIYVVEVHKKDHGLPDLWRQKSER